MLTFNEHLLSAKICYMAGYLLLTIFHKVGIIIIIIFILEWGNQDLGS